MKPSDRKKKTQVATWTSSSTWSPYHLFTLPTPIETNKKSCGGCSHLPRLRAPHRRAIRPLQLVRNAGQKPTAVTPWLLLLLRRRHAPRGVSATVAPLLLFRTEGVVAVVAKTNGEGQTSDSHAITSQLPSKQKAASTCIHHLQVR